MSTEPAGRECHGSESGEPVRDLLFQDGDTETMNKPSVQKIVPHLWYVKEAEEAARFYASVFPDSRVDRVTALPADSPSGPAGSVAIVEFTLCGQSFMAISAGPHHEFNDAVSFLVKCESQTEIDRYWQALLENGGKPQACGWIIDKWGVRWQIAPAVLGKLITDADKTKAKRVAEETLKQVKFDIAKLEAAFQGR
jgi:predicted 3-demethylubiquinone-9 3-methyltransferase (glyoxalase superfamily)